MEKVMSSYRKSHLDAAVAEEYESVFAGKVDSLIWDEFVKPWLFARLQAARESGARNYLDFACGTGRVLKVGWRAFGEGTGIDISERMLDFARRRVPDARLICADVTRQNVAGVGTFDCVTMFRFLRNAEPDLREEVLRWLASRMEHGSMLVVDNHGHSASIVGLFQGLAFWLTPSARNLLSRAETFQLLEGAGFEVESCDGYRILPSLFGRPILGRRLQAKMERLCRRVGLGRFGSELVIVARRV